MSSRSFLLAKLRKALARVANLADASKLMKALQSPAGGLGS